MLKRIIFLGMLLYFGWYISGALDEVFFNDAYEQATAGDHSEQLRIAQLYDQGKFVEQDKIKAVEWYERAAKNGSTIARTILCNNFKRGCKNVKTRKKD